MLTPQQPKNNKITSCKQESNCVYFYSESGILRVLVFNDSIIRISFTNENDFNIHQAEEFLEPENCANIIFYLQKIII